MKIEKSKLIEELIANTEASLTATKEFKHLSIETLNFKSSAREWSILECIQHLNLYGMFYLPEIERCLLDSKPEQQENIYKSSFIGDYFVSTIKAGNGKKMKTTKSMTPDQSNLSANTIDQFIKQLEKIQSLLRQAKKMDLVRNKTAISLTSLFKLRLGDTLRFVVYHNERHVLQAESMKAKVSEEQLV